MRDFLICYNCDAKQFWLDCSTAVVAHVVFSNVLATSLHYRKVNREYMLLQ